MNDAGESIQCDGIGNSVVLDSFKLTSWDEDSILHKIKARKKVRNLFKLILCF